MTPGPRAGAAGRGVDALCAALALALLAALVALSAWLWRGAQRPLLLAPAIGELSDCLEMAPPQSPLEAACAGPRGSAAARVEATLQPLGPQRSADGRFEMGYTLLVPLLNLFEPQAGGGWAVDAQAVRRIANTVQDVQRPVVLYLFSTHFSEHAPIEPVLAQDSANLAVTPAGPLPVDRFLGWPLYPWSIARTDNAITQRREQAVRAVVDGVCALPPAARQRIAGINLLGEVHHLYPDFEAGMGYGQPYVLTDYSDISRAGFRAFLRQRFGNVAALNAYLGSGFASFDDVEPPSKDIRRERLAHFWQHIDDAAAGTLAVGGWVHDAALPAGTMPWVRVYLDGQPVGRVPARFVRQDVADARPELGTAKVGWRYDLRFADQPPGVHRIDIALEAEGARLRLLGTRHVAVMGREQATPVALPLRQALPPMAPPGDGVQFWIDAPQDGRAVFYNPLVPLWHTYRGRQVVDYLAHFDRLLAGTCLAGVPHRTQQIYPAERAGWDSTRFASEASLLPFADVRLGINLYGEAGYDDSFFDWLARSRQPGYSVTEFHPLRAMDAPELRRLLLRHRTHGAHTFSFFVHPPPPGGVRDKPVGNPYALEPQNPRYGSDALYRAVQGVMQGGGTQK